MHKIIIIWKPIMPLIQAFKVRDDLFWLLCNKCASQRIANFSENWELRPKYGKCLTARLLHQVLHLLFCQQWLISLVAIMILRWTVFFLLALNMFNVSVFRSFSNGQWYCFNDQSVSRVGDITCIISKIQCYRGFIKGRALVRQIDRL